MGRRNPELEAVLAELHGAGVPYEIVPGGSHLKVRFSAHGREEFVTVSATGSDNRGVLNARADVRRILRGPQPATGEPGRALLTAAEAGEAAVKALADMKALVTMPGPAVVPVGPEKAAAEAPGPTASWVSAEDAAAVLGIGTSRLGQLARAGLVVARKIPGEERNPKGRWEYEETSVLARAERFPPARREPKAPKAAAKAAPGPLEVYLGPLYAEAKAAAEADRVDLVGYVQAAVEMAVAGSRRRHRGGRPFLEPAPASLSDELAALIERAVEKRLEDRAKSGAEKGGAP